VGDAALPGRAIDEGDVKDRLAIVADPVALAGVVATILEYITGLDVVRMTNQLRHRLALLRRTMRSATELKHLRLNPFFADSSVSTKCPVRCIDGFGGLLTKFVLRGRLHIPAPSIQTCSASLFSLDCRLDLSLNRLAEALDSVAEACDR
jgi:hypothetical protein